MPPTSRVVAAIMTLVGKADHAHRLVRSASLLWGQTKREELSQVNCRIICLLSCVGRNGWLLHMPETCTPLSGSARLAPMRTERASPGAYNPDKYGIVHPDKMILPYDIT